MFTEKIFISSERLKDFFRKDVAHDNIKSHKKNQSFTLCLENKIFGKSTGDQTGSQAFLGLIKDSRSVHIIDGVLSDFWYCLNSNISVSSEGITTPPKSLFSNTFL